MLSPIPKTSIGAKTIFLFKKNTSQIDRTLFIRKRHFLKKQIQNKSHINLKNRNFLFWHVINFNDAKLF